MLTENQGDPGPGQGALRTLLLGLVLLGCVGLSVELFLLDHYESFSQWAPFATLALGLGTGVALLARPGAPRVRLFQSAMLLILIAGLVGLWLHFAGNRAFELEIDPSTRGLTLIWAGLTGGVPSLAPGALVQLGLLGLILTYRHPALSSGGASSEEEDP